MTVTQQMSRLWLSVQTSLQIISHIAIKLTVLTGTLPYYRFFHFNTIDPVLRMANASQSGHTLVLLKLISRWRSRKLMELQFVSLACAVLAAAVIGSFSWSSISDAFWLALALWYSSLVLSILGVLLSAQQIAVLSLLGDLPERNTSEQTLKTLNRYLPLLLSRQQPLENMSESHSMINVSKPRWKMVFTWQCPMMFTSYSLLLFLAGLTILVCTSLVRGGDWNSDKNVAVVYLVIFAVAGVCFMACSFWVYHYVDLEPDATESDNMEGIVASTPPIQGFTGIYSMAKPYQTNQEPTETSAETRRSWQTSSQKEKSSGVDKRNVGSPTLDS